MANEIVGQIIALTKTQSLTSRNGNTYLHRVLAIAVQSFDQVTGEPTINFENTPEFTFIGDRCADLDPFHVGDIVRLSFTISGRKYVGQDGVEKIITEVRPLRCFPYGQRPSMPAPSAPAPQPSAGQPQYPQSQPQYPQGQPAAPAAASHPGYHNDF